MTASREQLPTREAIAGTWVSAVDTEMGEGRVELYFDREQVRATLYFGDDARANSIVTEDAYQLKEGWLSTNAMYKGRPMRMSLTGDTMCLEPSGEPSVELTRVQTGNSESD